MLARFVAERLITVDADAAQITHDALLAAWPRLRSSIEGGLEHLLTGRPVAEAARAWQAPGGKARPVARQPARGRPGWASEEDVPPGPARWPVSSSPRDRGGAGASAAERRRTRRLRRLVASLAVPVVAVGTLAGFAFQQRQEAATAVTTLTPGRSPSKAGQIRGQDAPLAAQLSVAAYDTAGTPRAAASLLESTGSPAAARCCDSAASCSRSASARTEGSSRRPPRSGRCGLGRHLARSPGAGRRPAGARQRQPAVRRRVQPGRADPGRGRGGRVVELWDVSQPAHPVRLARPDGPGQHGVLGRVQPGRKDAGRGQRR